MTTITKVTTTPTSTSDTVATAARPIETHHSPPTTTPQRTSASRTKTAVHEVAGGDISQCLSSDDLDALVLPLLRQHAVPARLLFDVRTERTSASVAERNIRRVLEQQQWVLLPTHVRHHWCATVLFLHDDGNVDATVFDSAPSNATRRDIIAVLRRLHVASADIRIVCHARQPRGSMECGLHVVLLALVQHYAARDGHAPLLLAERSSTTIDLSKWRPILSHHIRCGTAPTMSGLLDAVPAAKLLLPLELLRSALKPAEPAAVPLGGGKESPTAPSAPPTTTPAARLFEVRVLPQPLRPPADDNAPHDVIDVDAVDETHRVADGVGEAPLYEHEVAALAKNDADKRAVEEWFSQRHREAAADKHVAPRAIDRSRVGVAVRRVPANLAHLAADMATVARNKVSRDVARDEQRGFACFQPGEFLNDDVIDVAVAEIARVCPRVFCLPTREFTTYANQGRACAAVPPSGVAIVAVIVHLHNHFVLLLQRSPGSHIEAIDSLRPRAPSAELLNLAGRFLYWLSQRGRAAAPRLVLCDNPGQGLNDCGLESVRNLLRLLGVDRAGAVFSRECIRAAYHRAPTSAAEARQLLTKGIRDALTPAATAASANPSHGAPPSAVPVSQHSQQPLAATAAPSTSAPTKSSLLAARPRVRMHDPYGCPVVSDTATRAVASAEQEAQRPPTTAVSQTVVYRPVEAPVPTTMADRVRARPHTAVVRFDPSCPEPRPSPPPAPTPWTAAPTPPAIAAATASWAEVARRGTAQRDPAASAVKVIARSSAVPPPRLKRSEPVQVPASAPCPPKPSSAPVSSMVDRLRDKPHRPVVRFNPSDPDPPRPEAEPAMRIPSSSSRDHATSAPKRAPADPSVTTTAVAPKAAAESSRDEAPCCRRDKVDGNFCAWHHPRIVALRSRPKCTGMSALRKRCNEVAVAVCDPTLALRTWDSRFCWHHMAAPERDRLRLALADDAYRAPTAPTHTGDGGRPLPHTDVKNLIAPRGLGLVELDMKFPPFARSRFIAKIRAQPSRTQPGRIELLGRFCRRCDEWHALDLDAPVALPAVETSYFAISDPTQTAAQLTDIATPDCEDRDEGSDCDELDCGPAADTQELHNLADTTARVEDPDREPLHTLPAGPVASVRGDALRRFFIYHEKPPHVHRAVWAQLSAASRAEHARWLRRLHALPPELSRVPLPHAALEIVLRMAAERRWAWSTISSKLSALASAVKNLPLHSSAVQGYDLRADGYYSAAMNLAQKKARVASIRPQRSAPLTYDEYRELGRTMVRAPWVVLQLSWFLAARVGDVRRLEPANVHIGDAVDDNNTVSLSALFTQGKGAHFWGPYTIHSRLPVPIAKAVREYLAGRHDCVCSTADQTTLARSLAELPGHSLRSIRRGALVFLAECGVDDSSLQLVSGHRRRDTLLRYLSWGEFSSEATRAASSRAQLVSEAVRRRNAPVSGAGISTTTPHHPMWMGFNSGLNGDRNGRRVAPPPLLFPRQSPSTAELGIVSTDGDNSDDSASWPLHVKDVAPLHNVAAAHTHIQDPELRAATELAASWLLSDTGYGIPPRMQVVENQIPYSAFTPAQITTMLQGGKLLPWTPERHDTMRSAAKGFAVKQEAKRRWRPVFEPLFNANIDKERLPPLHYPARTARRAEVASASYVLQFDMSAWYDQLPLARGVENCYVIRTKQAVEWNGAMHTCFVLTRAPMGASWSAHCAQTILWAILEPVLRMPLVKVFTMIDNVAICSCDPTAFTTAVKRFIARCHEFGASLNDADLLPQRDDEILRAGRMIPDRAETFLGEVFQDGRVANTPRNVKKLALAFARLQAALSDESVVVTRRNLAALVGLATWMCHTLQIPVRKHFELLRVYSRIAAAASRWDDRARITPAMVNAIGKAVAPLLANVPVVPVTFPAPSPADFADDSFAATIIVDASATGFGAFVRIGSRIFELRAGWRTAIQHSAWAEPIAALEAVRWTRTKTPGRIAIVSDHIALVVAQRRPVSGNGGFSRSYHLNELYRELYADNLNHQVFFVDGASNPADPPSRANVIGAPPSAALRNDMTFPSLASFYHPYGPSWFETQTRKWWNV